MMAFSGSAATATETLSATRAIAVRQIMPIRDQSSMPILLSGTL
jgi:hypothetical protein